MSSRARWRIALPLIGLSSIFLVAAVAGAVAWWPDSGAVQRLLTVGITALLGAGLLTSVSIGLKNDDGDVPWTRVGIAVLALLLSCAVTLVRRNMS